MNFLLLFGIYRYRRYDEETGRRTWCCALESGSEMVEMGASVIRRLAVPPRNYRITLPNPRLQTSKGESSFSNLRNCLALTTVANRFSPSSITQYIIMLPLNLVPVVGTAAFLVLQGRKMGPSFHSRYFQLKGFNDDQRKDFIKQNKGAYIG